MPQSLPTASVTLKPYANAAFDTVVHELVAHEVCPNHNYTLYIILSTEEK